MTKAEEFVRKALAQHVEGPAAEEFVARQVDDLIAESRAAGRRLAEDELQARELAAQGSATLCLSCGVSWAVQAGVTDDEHALLLELLNDPKRVVPEISQLLRRRTNLFEAKIAAQCELLEEITGAVRFLFEAHALDGDRQLAGRIGAILDDIDQRLKASL